MRKAGDEDRAAAQEEERLHPFSDVPITQYGTGRIAVGLGSHPAA
jgi:hypothetical protein